MDDTRRDMGAKLREAREYVGLRQQEVAEALKIPRSAVSLIESGERKLETLELKQMAELYGRPISDFTGEEQRRTPDELQVLMRKAQAMSEQDREEIVRFADWLLARREREQTE